MSDVSEYLKVLVSAFGALTFTVAALVAVSNPVAPADLAPIYVPVGLIRA